MQSHRLPPAMIGETRLVAETLATYLELWGAERRAAFLESMYCYLHNEGHSLQRNTAGFDVEWLARSMYARRHGCAVNDLERAGATTQAEYKEIARIALECLPDLCDRIGARYVNASVALKNELEMQRAAVQAAERKA